MNKKEHEIAITFKARYHTLGEISTRTKKVWFVIHGYGQLSKYFLNKFKNVADSGAYVIAPEGLSKFYLEDVNSRVQSGNNRVGAAWMTRENRLTDIENYVHYLNKVYEAEVPQGFDGEITFLGFSQGAATVTRWALEGGHKFHRLIVWSGILPPDMDFDKAHEILKHKKVVEVYGKNDPLINSDKLQEVASLNLRLNIQPEIIEFDGGHEINEDVLSQLIM